MAGGMLRRGFMILALASVIGTPVLSGAAPAARVIPVQVKQVSVGEHASAGLGSALRSGVEAELSRSDFGPPPFARKYTLSASLVKLEHGGDSDAQRMTAVVGLVLYDERDSIIASIRGKASAEGADSKDTLSREALLGAVHSAVQRVAPAIKQIERR